MTIRSFQRKLGILSRYSFVFPLFGVFVFVGALYVGSAHQNGSGDIGRAVNILIATGVSMMLGGMLITSQMSKLLWPIHPTILELAISVILAEAGEGVTPSIQVI